MKMRILLCFSLFETLIYSQPPNNVYNDTTVLFDPPISHDPVKSTKIGGSSVLVKVAVTQPLDREQNNVLFITVTTKDNGKPQLSTISFSNKF